MVEFHLGAGADKKNNEEMMAYLRLAVQRGISMDLLKLDAVAAASVSRNRRWCGCWVQHHDRAGQRTDAVVVLPSACHQPGRRQARAIGTEP